MQLIGRLARVDPAHPQPSSLITIADVDVFPELKGVLRQLYEEDADWVEVLPGIIDADIERERLDREFAERLPASRTEVDPTHLRPLKRACVYEVPHDWQPTFLAAPLPPELQEGAPFVGGTILYAGADPDAGLLVVVVRYVDRPRWSTDPALADLRYELHVVAHRRPPRIDLPGLVLLNLSRDGVQRTARSSARMETNRAAGRLAKGAAGQSRTTGQVRVRATPSTAWIFETTRLPSASMFAASTRATTS